MTRLSVNINKIALIRNSRGSNLPNVSKVALDCEHFGADGITVHPRPDERHITRQDIYDLKEVVTTEFNIEGYPSDDFMEMVCAVKPNQVTLVPDAPSALTSDAGWDTITQYHLLKDIVSRLKNSGIRVSLFIDPIKERIEKAAELGTDRIELYTGPYAHNFNTNKAKAIASFSQASVWAKECNLGLNAGHDLNLENLKYFWENMTALEEVSIGHALVTDALYFGLENTIQMYQRKMTAY